jgi:enediyne biosynthesis protein E4
MKNHQRLLLASTSSILSFVLAGCASKGEPAATTPQMVMPEVAITSSSKKVKTSSVCSGQFLEHDLKHTTIVREGDRVVFDTNGSGLAVGDLDHDGLPEIVLGNVGGATSVQWNQGNFKFRSENLLTNFDLPETGTRAVQMIDFNADGWLDLAFTHTSGGINVWLNDHKRGFKAQSLEGVGNLAYTMLWDDLDGDGDLDLVTSSYDAILEAELRDTFLIAQNGGAVVYTNTNGKFKAKRLSKSTQTLALATFDVNGDGRRDIIVGNDFFVPDMTWLNTKKGWIKSQAFKRTSKNTMGYATSDVDNDGNLEFFATDMKPNMADPKAIASYLPIMQTSYETLQYKDPQRVENTLSQRMPDGKFKNMAYEMKIDATGWSWSGKFGDLNNDGSEDLYVVNGMIDKSTLKYLPNAEMVERNMAFVNTDGSFELEPAWKLDSTASGRGMSMTDLNNDGRLDVVVSNVSKPSQVFENQICNGGQSLQVDLDWAQTGNLNAIGSTIKLRVKNGSRLITMQREVNSQGGYLAGNNPRIHFGIPKGATLEHLDVIWPDGKHSSVKNPIGDSILKITREGSQQ